MTSLFQYRELGDLETLVALEFVCVSLNGLHVTFAEGDEERKEE